MQHFKALIEVSIYLYTIFIYFQANLEDKDVSVQPFLEASLSEGGEAVSASASGEAALKSDFVAKKFK